MIPRFAISLVLALLGAPMVAHGVEHHSSEWACAGTLLCYACGLVFGYGMGRSRP